MRVEPLANHLSTLKLSVDMQNGGIAVLSRRSNLFTNFIPDKVEFGAMIHSGLMRTPIDAELPNYRAGAMFQVVVRAREYTDGFNLMKQIMDALTTETRVQYGGMLFNYIRPQHEPLNYPLSIGNLIEFSVNFDCNYVIIGSDELTPPGS